MCAQGAWECQGPLAELGVPQALAALIQVVCSLSCSPILVNSPSQAFTYNKQRAHSLSSSGLRGIRTFTATSVLHLPGRLPRASSPWIRVGGPRNSVNQVRMISLGDKVPAMNFFRAICLKRERDMLSFNISWAF